MSSKFSKLTSWLHRSRDEKGQAMVMVAFSLVVILGFGAFAVDIGHVAVVKSDLQKTADAAALAGAADLIPSKSAIDQKAAEETAKKYANMNGMNVVDNHVPNDGETVDANALSGTEIQVTCTREVDYYFAGVLGFESKDVTAVAVARKGGNASSVSGLRPWALKNTYTYTYGLRFTLKVGGGGGAQGYYGIVGFGQDNANSTAIYKSNVTNGYNGNIKIGDKVNAASGNMNVKNEINALLTKTGDTVKDYTKAKPGNSRIVTIPKIDVNTRQITGFAAIYIVSVDNQGYITANFLYDTSWPQAQQDLYEDWGLKVSAKLSK